jgi:hypothetical protein
MNKNWILHRSPTRRYLKKALASLRNDSVTSWNLHLFVYSHFCKCFTRPCESIQLNTLDLKYLEWIKSIDSDQPGIFKIKLDLIKAFEKVQHIPSKHNDLLGLFKLLQFNAKCVGSLSKLISKYFNVPNLDFNEQNDFNQTFAFDFDVEKCMGVFVGKRFRNIQVLQTKYKCSIQIPRRDQLENLHLMNVKISGKSFTNFDRVKKELEYLRDRVQTYQKNVIECETTLEKESMNYDTMDLKLFNGTRFHKAHGSAAKKKDVNRREQKWVQRRVRILTSAAKMDRKNFQHKKKR